MKIKVRTFHLPQLVLAIALLGLSAPARAGNSGHY